MRLDPHPYVPTRSLVIDVGGSQTKVAVVTGGGVRRLGAFPSGGPGAEGWEHRFGEVAGRVRSAGIDLVAVSSPVPSLRHRVRAWLSAEWDAGVVVRTVGADTSPVPVDYQPAAALGGDRIANAVAALARWGAPVIVADVGTAITCDLVGTPGRFAGGLIAPGPWTAYRALVDRVPHLAVTGDLDGSTDLPALATTTGDGIRAGVITAAAALIDRFAAGQHDRLGPCPVVLTGGLAPLVARHAGRVTDVDPDLTLRGIHLACAAGQGV